MSEYVIQGETLTAIADAIRAKRDSVASIPTTSMAEEILAIVGGSAVASGVFTTEKDYTTEGPEITHDLGIVPDFFVWVIDDDISSIAAAHNVICGVSIVKSAIYDGGERVASVLCMYGRYDGTKTIYWNGFATTDMSGMTSTSCRMQYATYHHISSGRTYRWICGVLGGVS